MNLTTEVNNQVIIFHDGSRLFVTDKQVEKITEQIQLGQKGIWINKNYYTFSSISKIISLKDFYDQYPDQMPDYRKEFQPDKQSSENFTSDDILKRRKNYYKATLTSLKSELDKDIKLGIKPLGKLYTYNYILSKYKTEFKDLHDKEVQELAKEFDGQVVTS